MKKLFHVLIADQDIYLTRSIAGLLQREGYQASIALNSADAIDKLKTFTPDVIVIEKEVPDIGGYELCKIIRERQNNSTSYIILIANIIDDEDLLVGHYYDIDSYLVKPVRMLQLSLLLKSYYKHHKLLHIGETSEGKGKNILLADGLLLDCDDKLLKHIDGKPIMLTPKEFELLQFIVKNRGISFSRDELLNHVWGYEFPGTTRTVDLHMSTLRTKLQNYPGLTAKIKTVRNIGYRFE